MFSFKKFESAIEAQIVARGLDYYENGCVEDVEKIDPNEYLALVQGSEEYEVFVKIKDGIVVKQTCTCPYDWGEVCKHVVAVLYYMRDKGLDNLAEKASLKKQLKVILKELSGKELRQFVYQYAKRNRDFRQLFFEEFG